MENKKGIYNSTNVQRPNELQTNQAAPKHLHQHNQNTQNLRLLQYGLKVPNHSHSQATQLLKHQQLYHPHPHLHQHPHQLQSPYQPSHQHQPSPHQYSSQTPLIHQHNAPVQDYIQKQENITAHIHENKLQNALHPHNKLNQQNAQIWVPHQPPVYYHQQQPNREAAAQPQATTKPTTSIPKPKETVERKKSSGCQLRSPIAKRPPEAPVTMQGWLYKQGSDGLMLWKKRWFVLSEYCLFYYKGHEEERLLGSVLLPSYKVSICGPEDKVNKKFAFKCEHANMRTYILAADSQDLMMQWARVLNAASLLQTNNESEIQTPASTPVTNEKNTIVYYTQQHQPQHSQQQYSTRITPVHMYYPNNLSDVSNHSQYSQPLYANAPPKPRRVNDGSYSSPSPDLLDRYPYDPKYVTVQPPHPYDMPPTSRNITKSPLTMPHPSSIPPEYMTHPPPTHNLQHNIERRTPDTYGRSKTNPTKHRNPSDYEDIYSEQSMYKRPLSPLAYNNVKKVNPALTPIIRPFTPVSILGPRDMCLMVPVERRKSPSTIPRPHSADFLEYESNHQANSFNAVNRQPRPKSSLEINAPSDYFYSEQRYADKMRKSAQYLPKMANSTSFQNQFGTHQHRRNVPMEHDHTFPLMRSNTQPFSYNNMHLEQNRKDQFPVRSRSVLSEGSLSKDLEADLHEQYDSRGEMSPGPLTRQEQFESYHNEIVGRDYDQFTRSASASLAQNMKEMKQIRAESNAKSKEGDRKREESMKRLLEWKQRMLQSPLNRKVYQNSGKSFVNNSYKNQENGYSHNLNEVPYADSRSYHTLPQYNSYSSDDEENDEGRKDNEKAQAGRTMDSPSNSVTPAPKTLSVLNISHDSNPKTEHDTPCTPNNNSVNNNTEENNSESSDSKLTKALTLFPKDTPHIAQVSLLRSKFLQQMNNDSDINSSSSLVKMLLSDLEVANAEVNSSEECKTPTNVETNIEENYMTMTPKKNILDFSMFESNIKSNESDENHYVEMTQGLSTSLLAPNEDIQNSEQQPYEMVCFREGKIEPVYMELNQYKKDESVLNKSEQNFELPDILMPADKKQNKSVKSDGSDADDEASKDLDSLTAPNNPRFSLSDTYRPASYYLSTSQTVPEFQDSSDSELMSPPPIPRSPPSLDDLNNTDDCNNHGQDYSLSEQEKKDIFKFSKGDKIENYLLNFNGNPNLHLKQNDFDTSSRLSQNSDSYVELRTTGLLKSDYEQMLKRRPVSEEFCDELESLNVNFNETVNSLELNKYLHELENSNVSVRSESTNVSNSTVKLFPSSLVCKDNEFPDYENLCVVKNVGGNELVFQSMSSSISTIHTHSRGNSRDTTATIDSNTELRSVMSGNEFVGLRPDSSASNSIDLTDVLRQSIPQTSPGVMYFSDSKPSENNPNFIQYPPYYYSDLAMNTMKDPSSMLQLNNQRGTVNGNKRDIMHIVNPIRCSVSPLQTPQDMMSSTYKLAAEARSVSADFLNLTDKSGQIDKKNLYESDTLKRMKALDSSQGVASGSQSRNICGGNFDDKFLQNEVNDLRTANVRRSHSLEELLENVLTNETPESTNVRDLNESEDLNQSAIAEGSYLWEEDTIWRDRLRTVSQRHTKSLDNLDFIGEPKKQTKKQPRTITRGVTYVNDSVYNQNSHESKENKRPVLESKNSNREGSFIIDREKLRQWDLMSSAPSEAQSTKQSTQLMAQNDTVAVLSDTIDKLPDSEQNTTQNAASGSITINTRDTFPKAISAKKIWTPNSQHFQAKSVSNLAKQQEPDYGRLNRHTYSLNQPPSQHESLAARKGNWQWDGKMNVSAGELLGRTHEELVLLLIQLRRQSTNICHAIEAGYNEIDNLQAQLHLMDVAKRLENLKKLEQIKQHLLDLEKQYEKGKPLVNLVDSMVKLGTLYHKPSNRNNYNSTMKDRMEFNQKIQEHRLLAEEKRDWHRLNPNHAQLQEKVHQLYQLDHLIQEESGTLHNLQQNKEEIEKALSEIRHKLTKEHNNPFEIEVAKKQQAILENELSRVHFMLAENSKKLEETVAGNAKLEHELLVLKQKLQMSKQQRNSPQFSNAGDSLPSVVGSSAILESDLQQVQQKVNDLQRQRQELSMQVKQLTDRSNNFQQHSKQQSGFANKKKMHSSWRETDLDTLNIVDHGEQWEMPSNSTPTAPLYINTNSSDSDYLMHCNKSIDSSSDDTLQNSNYMPQEKQEIKTVRIVKRESERRQRDREKVSTGKCDPLLEEEDAYQSSLFRPAPVQKVASSSNIETLSPAPEFIDSPTSTLSKQNSLSSPSLPNAYADGRTELRSATLSETSSYKSSELSPVFKSEAAKQIITEMSLQDTPKQPNRRAVPKEKRRHHTAPHNNLIMKSLHHLPSDSSEFDKLPVNSRRARDDLDMERALRQRIDTPDVVRSTLSSKEVKYNESTIDNLLGTPNKINIPERYIPEQVPQLSAEEQEHRLRKVESIKKMLSDSAILSSSCANLTDDANDDSPTKSTLINKTTSKIIEEKKQREHLLQLNQILAKQVMEMSKIVAVKALQSLPLHPDQPSTEEDDLSPVTPLPLYQQRDNFYS